MSSASERDFQPGDAVYVWSKNVLGDWFKQHGDIVGPASDDAYTVNIYAGGEVKPDQETIHRSSIFRADEESEPPKARTVVKREDEDTAPADDAQDISSKRQRIVAGSVYQFKVRGFLSGPQFAVHESASLEDVVATAFNFGLEKDLDESMHSHLWEIGTSPDRMYECESAGFGKRMAKDVQLSHLNLSTGDALKLVYDFGDTRRFDLLIADIVPARGSDDLSPRDLGYEPVSYDGPIVTAAEAAIGSAFRKKVEAYMAGDNMWSWNKCAYTKPKTPDWDGSTQSDSVVVECLQEAGMGFAKAWKELMEPCLLLRTKSSASKFWYERQRHSNEYGESWVAEFYPEPSPREYLRKARTLLRIRREEALRYSLERKPPILEHMQLEVVFNDWWRKQPGVSDDDARTTMRDRDQYERLKADFQKIPMAEKLSMYIRRRQRMH